MNNPKITVVTICYNAASVIEETIQSVVNQTYNNIEYIIIDGASTDGTMSIVNKYRNQIATIVSEPDKGIYDAMNKGIRLATGDWINFMNGGDRFVDEKVLTTVFDNTELNNYGVIFGSWILKNGKHLRHCSPTPFFKSHNKIIGMGFSHQSVFVRTDLIKIHSFDLSFKLAADYNMIWHLYYVDKVPFKEVSASICVMDDTRGATISNYKLHLREVCQICGYTMTLFHRIKIDYLYLVYIFKRIVKSILYA